MTELTTDTYTYNPDLTRPYCPDCGSPVELPEHVFKQPFKVWHGLCPNGHERRYQMERE